MRQHVFDRILVRWRPGIALVVAFTLAACSASGPSESVPPTSAPSASASSASASSASASSASGEPVYIAAVEPTSGVFAEQGTNMMHGYQLAIDDINEAGGVLGGRPLELREGDAGADPQTAALTARRLLEDGQISALLGSFTSGHTATVSTVAEELKVPDITQAYNDGLLTRGYNYIFKLSPSSAVFSSATVSYLADIYKAAGKPLPSVAILASNDAGGQSLFDGAVAAAPAAGFDVVTSFQFPADIADTSPLVSRLIDAKPELIMFQGPTPVVVQTIKALRQAGVDVPIMNMGGIAVTRGFADAMGSDAEGVLATGIWNGDLSPAAADVNSRFVARFGGTFMPGEAGIAYAAAHVAAAGINAANSTVGADVAQAIHGLDLSGSDAEFMTGGRITFDETGFDPHAAPLLLQYQNGVPVTIWPEQFASAQPDL
jgi:branched-chain amino acid transport system substrate-binding protein